MALNNAPLFNAAIAGCSGAVLTGAVPIGVTPPSQVQSAVQAIATEIDSKIPAISGGATAAQANVMQSICQGMLARSGLPSTTAANYSAIADAIVVQWDQFEQILG